MRAVGSSYRVIGKLPSGDVLAMVLPRGEIRSLITGGFHGNEPAGALACLHWLEAHGPAEHTAFVPLVNPTGFARNVRHNLWGQDPNRKFTTGDPSIEGQILLTVKPDRLCPDGALMLHEDSALESSFFIYVQPQHSAELPAKLHATLSKWFEPLTTDEIEPKPVAGLTPHDRDTSFEDWMLQKGVEGVITVETPGKAPLVERIAAHMDCIKTFLAYADTKGDSLPARVARRWAAQS
jgi:predicted deacylase